MTQTTKSADGTRISFHGEGSGPSVVLVGGGLDDGSENAPLVPALAGEFTVYNYARRGRGSSGDTQPYAVEREIEDLAAMVDVAGGSAHLFGASSGAALALEATTAGLPVEQLVIYDAPFSVDPEATQRWVAYREVLSTALADGRTDDALAAFMKLSGASDTDIDGVRSSPFWEGSVLLAPTLAYDAAVMGHGGPLPDRFASITQPTLILDRATSDPYMPALDVDFFRTAADALASRLANSTRQTIEAPGHAVDAAAVAPAVAAFLRRKS